MHLSSPPYLGYYPFLGGGSVFVDLLFNALPLPEEKAGCSAVIVLQMSCYCKCSVALPHGSMGWSAVCDCGSS